MLEELNRRALQENDLFTYPRLVQVTAKNDIWRFVITSPMGKALHLRELLHMSGATYIHRLWLPVLLYTKYAATVAHHKAYGLIGLTQH